MTKVTICAIHCLALIGLLNVSHVRGQAMPKPSTLLTSDALLLIETTDAGEIIAKLNRHWHNVYFGEAVTSGRIMPLSLPLDSHLTMWLSTGQKSHWLTESLKALRQSKFPLAADLVGLADRLKDEGNHDTTRIVELLAELFPGRGFVGVENKEPFFSLVFGFEYDPAAFDWLEELTQTARDQTGANLLPVATIGAVDIYALPVEEVYFFGFKNVIYGVCDTDVDYCAKLAGRVQGKNEGTKDLTQSRYFQRVADRLGYGTAGSDVFGFARYEELFTRRMVGLKAPGGERIRMLKTKEARDMRRFPGNTLGFTIDFGLGSNDIQFRAVYPLIHPMSDPLRKMLTELKPLEPDRDRSMVPGASAMVFVRHDKLDLSQAMDDGRYRIGDELFLRTWEYKSSGNESNGGYGEDRRLPNPVQFAEEFTSEYGKFVIPLFEPEFRFIDEDKSIQRSLSDTETLNGYVFPSHGNVMNRDDLLALSEKMIDSKLYARFQRRKIPRKMAPQSDDSTERTEIEEIQATRNSDHSVKYYGRGNAAFGVVELGSRGVQMFSVPVLESRRELVDRMRVDGELSTFNAERTFNGGIAPHGQLKGLLLQSSNFDCFNGFNEVFRPLALFCSWAGNDINVSPDDPIVEIYLANDQSFLTKFFRFGSMTTCSGSSNSLIRSSRVPVRFEKGMLQALALVTDCEDWIEYHGVVRRELMQKE